VTLVLYGFATLDKCARYRMSGRADLNALAAAAILISDLIRLTWMRCILADFHSEPHG